MLSGLPQHRYLIHHNIDIWSTTISLSGPPQYRFWSTTTSLSGPPQYRYLVHHNIAIWSTTISLSGLPQYRYLVHHNIATWSTTISPSGPPQYRYLVHHNIAIGPPRHSPKVYKVTGRGWWRCKKCVFLPVTSTLLHRKDYIQYKTYFEWTMH
jgi:hypothetical protein